MTIKLRVKPVNTPCLYDRMHWAPWSAVSAKSVCPWLESFQPRSSRPRSRPCVRCSCVFRDTSPEHLKYSSLGLTTLSFERLMDTSRIVSCLSSNVRLVADQRLWQLGSIKLILQALNIRFFLCEIKRILRQCVSFSACERMFRELLNYPLRIEFSQRFQIFRLGRKR